MLITFLLCQAGVLREPLLYLSLYFKQRRAEYYGLLDRVRHDGDWEAWLAFFLDGVVKTASGAVETAQRLTTLFAADRAAIQAQGRKASSALRVHDTLQRRPVTKLQEVAATTGLAFPTAGVGMQVLVDLGIAAEVTGKQRKRVYAYTKYLSVLNEGTETS